MNEINKCAGCPNLLASQISLDAQLQETLPIIDRQVNMYVSQLSLEDEIYNANLPDTDNWIEAVSGVMTNAQEGLQDELQTKIQRMAFTKRYMNELLSNCEIGIIKYRPTTFGKMAITCGSPLASLQATAEDLADLRPMISQEPQLQIELQTKEELSAK